MAEIRADFAKMLEEFREEAIKITPKDIETKKEHPLWYVYRNSRAMMDKWIELSNSLVDDVSTEERLATLNMCHELLDHPDTNGNAMEYIASLSSPYSEIFTRSEGGFDDSVFEQWPELIMHVAQHKNVPDSEIEEKVSKAIYQFEKILKEHPELADRMFAKYSSDFDKLPKRLAIIIFNSAVRGGQSIEFLKGAKRIASSEASIKSPNRIFDINELIISKEPENKEILDEMWGYFQSMKPEDIKKKFPQGRLESYIQHASKDTKRLLDVVAFMEKESDNKQHLDMSTTIEKLIKETIKNCPEPQKIYDVLIPKLTTGDIHILQAKFGKDKIFGSLCQKIMDERYLAALNDKKSALIKLSESLDQGTEKNFSSVVSQCKSGLQRFSKEKSIAQLVISIADKLPLNDAHLIGDILYLHDTVATSFPELADKNKRSSIQNTLDTSIRELLKEEKIKEALEQLVIKEKSKKTSEIKTGLTSDATAYPHLLSMDVEGDVLRHKIMNMDNGCVAVGFLCEDRSWKNLGLYTNGGGIAWRWYASGMIIDLQKAEIVKSCKTATIQVRHPYDARLDIYNDIDMNNFMWTKGDKLTVCLGHHAEASTEYNPKREAQIEGSLARISKHKEVHANKEQSTAPSTHDSNSPTPTKPNGRDDGGR